MKPFIIGLATLLLSITLLVFNEDYRQNNYYSKDLKYVAEEVSASGALFTSTSDFSDGRIVFNQIEAVKAIEYQLKNLLRLDDSFNPLPNSYWTEHVSYKVYFYDDSNSTFPFTFNDPDTLFTFTVAQPTVIVTIDAGKARYRLPFLRNSGNFIRSAAHEWHKRLN